MLNKHTASDRWIRARAYCVASPVVTNVNFFAVVKVVAAPKASELVSVFPVLLPPQLAYLLSQFQYFVCPVGFNSETNGFTVECEPSDIFVMQEYTLPAVFQRTLGLVRLQRSPCQQMFMETFAFRKAADLHFCFCAAFFVHSGQEKKSASHILKKIFSYFPLSGKSQHVPLSDPQHLPVVVCVPHRTFWWFLCQWF